MTTKPYPSETADRYIVRMPEGMRDKVKALADRRKRSMNAEIVAAIEAHLFDAAADPDFQEAKVVHGPPLPVEVLTRPERSAEEREAFFEIVRLAEERAQKQTTERLDAIEAQIRKLTKKLIGE
jgi:hypothetical protein